MADNDNEGWFKTAESGFGTFTDKDDFLHPECAETGSSLTETQYFGFNIPEENIYGFSYLWLHPNLNVATGGLFVCQGLKRSHLQAELFDVHAYLGQDEVLTNDLHSFILPNSYRVDVLEPGQRMRIRYHDSDRQNSLDMTATAIMPVAMRANNMHFEQAVRNAGDLVLRGKPYRIQNTYNVRDRSWGQLRPEGINPVPPYTWMTGTFTENFAFNCSAFDHPDLDPEWAGQIDWPADKVFNDGWIFKDDELIRAKSAKKITRRDPLTGRPLHHDIELIDENDRVYHIKGTTTAGLPWSGWPNMTCHLYLTRWQCEGLTGWGDTQECQWNDYVRKFSQTVS
jgi:hypothetical protein